MEYKDEAIFWRKKEFISFLLSILVFFIHSYFAPYAANDSFIATVNHKVSYFFSRSVTQFAVPMFFILSGITFFKGYSNKKYPTKIKSRIFTLVIPYLLWNTIWMLWKIFISGESSILTLQGILKGIFFYGCNPPFWFIFDLIIFSFAAPLVFLIIKNKYVGMTAIILLPIVSLSGIHLPEKLFYYPMAIVFYLLGAVIGYHYFGFAAAKASKKMQIASAVFLSAYILAKNIAPREIHIDNYLTQTIVYALSAFSLWNVTDIFIEKIKPLPIYSRSFAVYAMHLNVAVVVLKVFSIVFPQSEWFEIPKFIISIVLTLAIINVACIILERFLPKIYATLMGNRINRAK